MSRMVGSRTEIAFAHRDFIVQRSNLRGKLERV